jgi:hypothetical protein
VSAFNTPEFRKLQKQWYAKLAESGFKDIEQTDWESGEQSLREYAVSRPYDERKAAYYRRACEYARQLERETDIWRLHSEGYTLRRIVAALRREWPDLTDDSCEDIIRRHRARMVRATRVDP